MKLSSLPYLLGLISAAAPLAPSLAGAAQSLPYGVTSATNRADAVTKGQAEGKIILADFGRPSCSECTVFEGELLNRAPDQWLQAAYVLWTADVDTSTEWRTYTNGLVGGLPLVCFVDPSNSGTFISRFYGGLSPSTLLATLKDLALKSLPLVVTNLPGTPLTNAAFTIQGESRTNATIRNAITNVPIVAIMWRLKEAGGDFLTAQGTTNWSAQLTLVGNTNTLETYVRYEDGRTSWINRVVLLYNGPPLGTPPVILVDDGGFGFRSGNFQFDLIGTAGEVVVMEASTNLANWIPLTTNIIGTDPLNFSDSSASTFTRRFYRARRQ